MSIMLRAHLFGGLTLAWHDEPLPTIPSRSARSLLAYLLTYRDQPHTRDLLAGTFWPELPDATARRRLSQALWQIRHAFDPQPVLLTKADAIQQAPDLPLWLDVEQFTQHHAHCTGSDAEAIEHGTECVELYQGEFLAGYYDDWAIVERERLRDMFLEVLERLVMGHKRRGEYERALLCARRLANEAPWREQAHSEVMRLCHLLGRESEALKQFETCCQALQEELGAEPSSATLALAREIAYRSDPGLTVDLPWAAAAPVALVLDGPEATELPLVGREEQRTELLAHVEALLRGLGGVLLVEGEAGVGKTRLLQTIARGAEWRGAQVLWGAGREVEGATLYGPLVEALSEGLTPLRISQLEPLVESIWLRVLAPLLPPLASSLPDLAPAPQLDPAQERTRLVAALGQLLADWSQVAPLLLVVEDLHWAGEDTLDLLTRLPAAVGEQPVLIVGSYRSEEARSRPAVWDRLQALDRAGVRQRLELGGLHAETMGELVRRCLGMTSAAPLFETRLYQETQGNPLFVLETLRALHGEGLLVRDESGGWRTPWDETTDDYAELPLPRAVEQTIARRLDSLSPSLRQTIHRAAVLGERFGFDLLRAAGDGEPQSLLAALRELVQRRFLDETERDYRFSHDKVRQVAYEGIDLSQRSGLHRRVAQAFEALQPERVATLAYHWTQAEEWEQGADYHRQAGDRARVVYANAEAVAHYSQALAALERLPGPVDPVFRYELHLAREAIYDLLGEREVQAKDLKALDELVQVLNDNRRAKVVLRQTGYAEAISNYAAAIEMAQEAVRLAQSAPDAYLEAEGQRHWGNILWRQGDYEGARTHLEAALRLAQCCSLHVVEAKSLSDLGTVSAQQGDYDQARICLEQALHLFGEMGNRQREGAVLNNLGILTRLQGDYAGAREYHDRSLHIRREIGDWRGESSVLNSLGIVCRCQGDFARARTYFEQALVIMRKVGDRWFEGRTLNNLGTSALNLGDYVAGQTCYERSLRLCREIGDRSSEVVSLEGLGYVYHYQGDDLAAYRHLVAALRLARDLDYRSGIGHVLTGLGIVQLSLGDLPEAAAAYRQSLDLRRELGQHHLTLEPLAGLANVFLARGNAAQAQEFVEEILSCLHSMEGSGRVYLTCYRVLRANQDPRAKEILTTAHDRLQERAAKIDDEELRRSFLENVATHREIVAAYREPQTVPQEGRLVVSLPEANAPQGRPLRDDEYVTVTWTVDAPEDAAIQGKAARRRQRLLRLLSEAEAQGAVPRDQDLAAALGVSLRTLRRDVAALRAVGHALPARRRKMAS